MISITARVRGLFAPGPHVKTLVDDCEEVTVLEGGGHPLLVGKLQNIISRLGVKMIGTEREILLLPDSLFYVLSY